jgi:hypothetical protein
MADVPKKEVGHSTMVVEEENRLYSNAVRAA